MYKIKPTSQKNNFPVVDNLNTLLEIATISN